LSNVCHRGKKPSLIITEDSDVVPYAVRTTMFKLDSDFNGQVLRYRDISSKNDKLNWTGFGEVHVLLACIGSGCDYLDNLPGVGLITSTHYVRDAFSMDTTSTSRLDTSPLHPVEKLIQLLLRNHGRNLTPTEKRQYEQTFINSIALFRHPVVYDER
tara:strand:- start:574 stop:1044 length:471 start_codon:yes stop_codon:yes gene_type:complete